MKYARLSGIDRDLPPGSVKRLETPLPRAEEVEMPPNGLPERLSATAELADPHGQYRPVPGKPVYSTINVKGTTRDFYDKIVARMNFPKNLPTGILGHVVFSEPGRINVSSAWETAENGDANFRDAVAPSAALVIADSDERSDVVREEYRLCSFITGSGIGAFAAECFDRPPRAWVYRLVSHAPLDDQSGHTLREYFKRVAAIGASPEMVAARRQGLELQFGGVIDDGMTMIYLHTNKTAAKKLFAETIPEISAEHFADWPGRQVSVESFDLYRCVVPQPTDQDQ